MSKSPPPKPSADNNDLTVMLIVLVVLPLAIYMGWTVAGRHIFAYERTALYWLLSFGGSIPADTPVLGALTQKYMFFRYTDPKEMEFMGDAVRDSMWVNLGFLVISGIVVLLGALKVLKQHPMSVYGRKLNLYDFVHSQMPLYPHLSLMWRLRLLARPLHTGWFRMGDSAKGLCLRNELVKMGSANAEPLVQEDLASDLFVAQLGRMLPMPDAVEANLKSEEGARSYARKVVAVLSNNEKALLAAILPRLASCDEDIDNAGFYGGLALSEQMVDQFWASYTNYFPDLPSPKDDLDNPLNPPPPPVDTTGCDEVLLKYLQPTYVRKILLAHAYIRTFLYDALMSSRRVGKFPPAQFRWLRLYDRGLWYTVNGAGRSTPFWEAAGLHAHYLYEAKAGKAVELPQVTEAVAALKQELDLRIQFSDKEKELIWLAQEQAKHLKTEDINAVAEVGGKKLWAALKKESDMGAT